MCSTTALAASPVPPGQTIFEGEQSLTEQATRLAVEPAAPAGEGTFDVVFCLDKPVNMTRMTDATRILDLEMPGFSLLRLELTGEPLESRRELLALWRSLDGGDGHDMWNRYYFIQFEQNKTYHLTITWDEEGLFKCYLNGYLVDVARSDPPSSATRLNRVILRGEDARLLALHHWDQALNEAQVAAAAGQPVPAPVPSEVGQNHGDRQLDVSGELTLIHESELAEQADIDGWVMEGPGEVRFEDGWMILASGAPTAENRTGHFTFWTPVDLPEEYLIRWRFRPVNAQGLAMMILDAQGLGGEDLFDPSLAPRHGNFPEYWRGDIRSYHFSYLDSGEWVRVNKNPNKLLFAMGLRPRYEAGRVYELSVMKRDDHLIHAIDGQVIFDAEDREAWFGPPWHGGKLGLRQMKPCVAAYQDLRIYRIDD